MSLKIVTGGTTGVADGTLVSSSNKITFLGIDTVVDAHIRVDDDTYSADSNLSVPTDGSIQISFDGGSTWKAFADNPFNTSTLLGPGGIDVGDLNFPIKLRQHAATASVSGTFTSDGSFVAATAHSNPTGFTATRVSATAIDLAWSAPGTDPTYYKIERATDSGFTANLTTLTSTLAGSARSYSSTGLTQGTRYYYRLTAVGTVRYKDCATPATANAVPYGRIAWTSEALLYQFNEGSGTNIDDKNTSSNKDGTLTLGSGGSWLATGSPWADPCIDASVGYTVVPTWAADGAPSQQAAGTYEFIAKVDSPVSANIQMLLYDGFQYFGVNTDGKLVFWTRKSGPTDRQCDGGTVLTAATWYHLSVAWDGSNTYVYINGVQDGTMAFGGECADTSAITSNIGGRSSFTVQGFDGKLAMARIWNSKRSAAQLLAAKAELLG